MMKYAMSFIAFVFTLHSIFGQENKTIEIEQNFSNGYAKFSVLETNPRIDINYDSKYYWYSKRTGYQETQGSFSGSLLHGQFQFFNKSGQLINQNSFYNGVLSGEKITWDEKGGYGNKAEYRWWKMCLLLSL